MKKLPVVIALAFLVGLAWFVMRLPESEEQGVPDVEVDVAVRVGSLTRSTLRGYVTAYGSVAPEPAGERPAASASISPSVAGVVVAVNVVEGEKVSKGQALFQLDSRAADVAVEFAALALDREKRLKEIDGTSEKSVQSAEQQLDAARVQQALLNVPSPLDGTVVRLLVKPGEAVDLATVTAEVIDLERLVVVASVPSAELEDLRVGQEARFTLDRAAEPVIGAISFISPQVDPLNGTAEIRVALPGGSRLRPGQLGIVRITSKEHPDVLAVPLASVVRDAQGKSVISIVESGVARQRRVTTGLSDAGMIEVEGDGLRPGLTVVTQGAYGLPEETKVHVVEN